MEGSDKILRIKSSDGHVIECEMSALRQAKLINDMFENDEVPSDEIDLGSSFLKKSVLDKVLEYCRFVAANNNPPKIQKPIKQNNIYDITSPWYATFVNQFEDEHLSEMILAVNYLNIQPLLELLCAKLALTLKTMDVGEVRRYFGIENDYAPEEEKRVQEEKIEAMEIYELEDDNN